MATQYITRRSALLGRDQKPNANSIYLDSDDEQVKVGSGASGTTENTLADLATAQSMSNKTLVAPVLSGSVTGTYTLAGTPTLTAPLLTNPIIQTALVAGGTSLVITAALHAGKTMAFDTAAGTAFVLPAASGTGNKYTFIVTVSETTNQHRISVVGTDAMLGNAWALDTDLETPIAFAAAADTDRIDMTQETGFGAIGTRVELVDLAAGVWFVHLTGDGDASVTTPFVTGAVS